MGFSRYQVGTFCRGGSGAVYYVTEVSGTETAKGYRVLDGNPGGQNGPGPPGKVTFLTTKGMVEGPITDPEQVILYKRALAQFVLEGKVIL